MSERKVPRKCDDSACCLRTGEASHSSIWTLKHGDQFLAFASREEAYLWSDKLIGGGTVYECQPVVLAERGRPDASPEEPECWCGNDRDLGREAECPMHGPAPGRERARLDEDGTAKPLTEIAAVMPETAIGGGGRTVHVGQATHYVHRRTEGARNDESVSADGGAAPGHEVGRHEASTVLGQATPNGPCDRLGGQGDARGQVPMAGVKPNASPSGCPKGCDWGAPHGGDCYVAKLASPAPSQAGDLVPPEVQAAADEIRRVHAARSSRSSSQAPSDRERAAGVTHIYGLIDESARGALLHGVTRLLAEVRRETIEACAKAVEYHVGDGLSTPALARVVRNLSSDGSGNGGGSDG